MLDDISASGQMDSLTITYPYDGGIQHITCSGNLPSSQSIAGSGFLPWAQPQQDVDFGQFHQSLDAVLEECEKRNEEESKLPQELSEPGDWEKSTNKKRDEIMRRMFE